MSAHNRAAKTTTAIAQATRSRRRRPLPLPNRTARSTASATLKYSEGTIQSDRRSASGTWPSPAKTNAESVVSASTIPSGLGALRANPASASPHRLVHNAVPPGFPASGSTRAASHATVDRTPTPSGGSSARPIPMQIRTAMRIPNRQQVVCAERDDPQCAGTDNRDRRRQPIAAPGRDEKKQPACRGNQERAVGKELSQRGDRPPHGRAADSLGRAAALERPHRQRGQQQAPERIGGVVFDLEAIVRDQRRGPAQEDQNRGAESGHPPRSDPHRGCHRRDAEQQRHQTQHQFGATQREQDGALQDQPAERCALAEPERSGQFEEPAIADVQCDGFFVKPERRRTGPLIDVERDADDRDRCGGCQRQERAATRAARASRATPQHGGGAAHPATRPIRRRAIQRDAARTAPHAASHEHGQDHDVSRVARGEPKRAQLEDEPSGAGGGDGPCQCEAGEDEQYPTKKNQPASSHLTRSLLTSAAESATRNSFIAACYSRESLLVEFIDVGWRASSAGTRIADSRGSAAVVHAGPGRRVVDRKPDQSQTGGSLQAGL